MEDLRVLGQLLESRAGAEAAAQALVEKRSQHVEAAVAGMELEVSAEAEAHALVEAAVRPAFCI